MADGKQIVKSDIGNPEPITIEKAQWYLEGPYPVWHLDPHGRILAANLLMLWLWEVRQFIDANNFFGHSVFDIFAQQGHRIPDEGNQEFFEKKIPIFKRIVGEHEEHKELHKDFFAWKESDRRLKRIYEEQRPIPDSKWVHERVWEYPIILTAPQYPAILAAPSGTHIDGYLHLHATVYRVESLEGDFIGVWEADQKSTGTKFIIEQVYQELKSLKNVIAYVQYKHGEKRGGDLNIKEQDPGRTSERSEPKKVLSVEELNKISYKIPFEVERLNANIPPDEPDADGGIMLIPIHFTPEYRKFGHNVLFYVNDFMDTNEAEERDELVYHVFPRTVRILDEIGIPYENLSSQYNDASPQPEAK